MIEILTQILEERNFDTLILILKYSYLCLVIVEEGEREREREREVAGVGMCSYCLKQIELAQLQVLIALEWVDAC